MPKQTGYLGPPGTFGEQAALHYDRKSTLVSFPSHTTVVQAVLQGGVDEGIVAVENSLEGAVSETLDVLLRSEVRSTPSGPFWHRFDVLSPYCIIP